MPTTAHKLSTIANNHGMIALGPYTTAALRRAAVLTSADVGKVARQTDTTPATLWYVESVASGVGTWRKITTETDNVFNPASVFLTTGVLLYLDASLGVTLGSGNDVASWTSQDSNAFVFAQATAGSRPQKTAADSTLNGQDTIGSDGGDELGNTGIVIPANYWRSIVYKVNTWVLNRWLVCTAGGAGKGLLFSGVSPGIGLAENGSGISHPGAAVGTWKHVIDHQQNTGADNIEVGSVAGTPSALGRTTSATGLALFNQPGGGAGSTSSIACVVITPGQPTAPEIDAWKTMLAGKYLASINT